MDPARNKQQVVRQSINYGDLSHWRWIRHQYSPEAIRHFLQKRPTAFRARVLRLARILFR